MIYWFLKDARRRAAPQAHLPPVGAGAEEHPRDRPCDSRQQPPVLLGLLLPARHGAPADHLPGQDGVLHRPGRQGPAAPSGSSWASGRSRSTGRAVQRARRRSSPASRCCARGSCSGSTRRAPGRPDGRLYKGKTGVARMALEAGCPVIPVAMINTDKAQPTGQKVPNIVRIGIKIGRPLDFSPLRGHGERPVRPALDHRRDHVRADAPVRPGVCRRVRRVAQEERDPDRHRQGPGAAGRADEADGRGAVGRRAVAPSRRATEPASAPATAGLVASGEGIQRRAS